MSNTQHRVSIGLPVFNGEKYINQAVDSILAQTFTDFELLILDNASTDNTPAICRSYLAKDPRVHYYHNDKNLGAAPNFNRVFGMSSGDYFKWAANDDIIAPNFLEKCVEILDRNSAIILCYPRAKIINENGAYVNDYNPGPDTNSPNPQDRFRNLILHPEYAIQQMGLFRAEVLRKTVLYGSYPSSDEVLLAQLSLIGEFFEIPERLFLYRIYPEQSTQLVKTQRDRVSFFDTSLMTKIILPKWLYFMACMKVVASTQISQSAKISCYSTMVRWLLIPAHFKAMGKDVLLALQKSTAIALSSLGTLIHF